MIKISVIIPVYNEEEYLNECIDSVINQSYENLEIISINDKSTDNSLKILEDYAQKDSRITLINNPKNKGLGFSRNVGLKYATGDYIFFIDSDDSILENTLELLLKNAISNDSDVVLYKLLFYNNVTGECAPAPHIIENSLGDVDFSNFTFNYKDIKKYFLRITPTAWSKFYKKEFLDSYDDLIFPINITYEDVLFHVKVLLRASKISLLPENLYKNRIANPNSIMSDFSRSIEIIKVLDSVESFLHDYNYYDEIELEFIIFKIDQLRYHFNRLKTNEFKELIKKEFEMMDLNNKEEYIPKNLLDFYRSILES